MPSSTTGKGAKLGRAAPKRGRPAEEDSVTEAVGAEPNKRQRTTATARGTSSSTSKASSSSRGVVRKNQQQPGGAKDVPHEALKKPKTSAASSSSTSTSSTTGKRRPLSGKNVEEDAEDEASSTTCNVKTSSSESLLLNSETDANKPSPTYAYRPSLDWTLGLLIQPTGWTCEKPLQELEEDGVLRRLPQRTRAGQPIFVSRFSWPEEVDKVARSAGTTTNSLGAEEFDVCNFSLSSEADESPSSSSSGDDNALEGDDVPPQEQHDEERRSGSAVRRQGMHFVLDEDERLLEIPPSTAVDSAPSASSSNKPSLKTRLARHKRLPTGRPFCAEVRWALLRFLQQDPVGEGLALDVVEMWSEYLNAVVRRRKPAGPPRFAKRRDMPWTFDMSYHLRESKSITWAWKFPHERVCRYLDPKILEAMTTRLRPKFQLLLDPKIPEATTTRLQPKSQRIKTAIVGNRDSDSWEEKPLKDKAAAARKGKGSAAMQGQQRSSAINVLDDGRDSDSSEGHESGIYERYWSFNPKARDLFRFTSNVSEKIPPVLASSATSSSVGNTAKNQTVNNKKDRLFEAQSKEDGDQASHSPKKGELAIAANLRACTKLTVSFASLFAPSSPAEGESASSASCSKKMKAAGPAQAKKQGSSTFSGEQGSSSSTAKQGASTKKTKEALGKQRGGIHPTTSASSVPAGLELRIPENPDRMLASDFCELVTSTSWHLGDSEGHFLEIETPKSRSLRKQEQGEIYCCDACCPRDKLKSKDCRSQFGQDTLALRTIEALCPWRSKRHATDFWTRDNHAFCRGVFDEDDEDGVSLWFEDFDLVMSGADDEWPYSSRRLPKKAAQRIRDRAFFPKSMKKYLDEFDDSSCASVPRTSHKNKRDTSTSSPSTSCTATRATKNKQQMRISDDVKIEKLLTQGTSSQSTNKKSDKNINGRAAAEGNKRQHVATAVSLDLERLLDEDRDAQLAALSERADETPWTPGSLPPDITVCCSFGGSAETGNYGCDGCCPACGCVALFHGRPPLTEPVKLLRGADWDTAAKSMRTHECGVDFYRSRGVKIFVGQWWHGESETQREKILDDIFSGRCFWKPVDHDTTHSSWDGHEKRWIP
ncbi:unnamed protein product [Amoebophrya sp. A25]|nr:unnamed protein product [Amoebophrya sp. A25]|eukprot:GSA25T00024647001.1